MINWQELEELVSVKQQEAVFTNEDRDLLALADEVELERRTLRRRLADAFVFVGNKLDPSSIEDARES